MNKKTVRDIDVKGKKVLVRCDFNVPLDVNKNITDNRRIVGALPTIKYLLDNENIALSRDKILNNVWNYDYYGDSRTIDSHIKKIRHKLGKKGKYIETVRGIGYKFEIKK